MIVFDPSYYSNNVMRDYGLYTSQFCVFRVLDISLILSCPGPPCDPQGTSMPVQVKERVDYISQNVVHNVPNTR